MADIKFLGYKPEFIESSKYFPFIQDAIENDKLYSPQEIDNLLQQATQIASEQDIYAKFYIDVVYSVDGQRKRNHHGIRADIDGEYSKGDFMPIHDEIWSYLEDVAKKEYYKAEQRLAELKGTQNEGKQVDEKDYKWKELKYIKNGQVYGKVGRRIGIAAPTTLPSSEGPIPGPGAEGGGDCGGCSESKLSEEWVNHLSEADVARLLELISDFIYKIDDNFTSVPGIHTEEARNKVYDLYDEIYEYLKKYYPESNLIKSYNLDESLKEDISTSRPTLQQIFDEGQLDGIDVYDTDYDVDGCYVPNIQTPADNYDAFVKYFCRNSYVDEYDDDYATVNFCDFIKNNKAALEEWLDIDPEWDEDDAEEYIVEQLITALAGNGSESQYREFMRIIGR